MLHQVRDYRERIAFALESDDLSELKQCSESCEAFLRENLPTYPASAENIEQMITELEQLVVLYRRAVGVVELARQQARDHISKLGRNRASAVKYLDVASNFPG